MGVVNSGGLSSGSVGLSRVSALPGAKPEEAKIARAREISRMRIFASAARDALSLRASLSNWLREPCFASPHASLINASQSPQLNLAILPVKMALPASPCSSVGRNRMRGDNRNNFQELSDPPLSFHSRSAPLQARRKEP